jgi:hypothetical protein
MLQKTHSMMLIAATTPVMGSGCEDPVRIDVCLVTVRLSLNFILGGKIYTLDREDRVG